MRFIHTADWHIGKVLNDHSLLEQQADLCRQIVELVRQTKAEALVIAGDIYDRAIPGSLAMKLVHQTLETVIQECDVSVLMIAGNHDSQQLIEYNSALLQPQHLYAQGVASETIQSITLGETTFHLFPFLTPTQATQLYQQELHTYQEVLECQLQHSTLSKETYNVAIYHGYVTNQLDDVEQDDSERPLVIGTAQMVSAELFKDFDYVCCGHLHRAHAVGSDKIQYSGSLYKYSKSEAGYRPCVLEVELENHQLTVTKHHLSLSQDVLVKQGYFQELLTQSSQDYIYFELLDQHYQYEAMNQLLKQYPNTLSLEYINLQRNELFDKAQISNRKDKDVIELFEQFYQEVMNQPLTNLQKSSLLDCYEELNHEN